MRSDRLSLLELLPAQDHTTLQADLITCSLCLRVLRGSDWIEAEQVIREIRSYELAAPPRLQPGLCDLCAASILRRRTRAGDALAA
jgi:hypothetical protein